MFFSSRHIWIWDLDHKQSWALKNWCFQTVVLEKTLESPLDGKEINSEYSLEGLMLKLMLQYFGHLMQTADSLGKTLILGKVEGKRRRGQQRMGLFDGITDSVEMNLSKLREIVKGSEAWCGAVHGISKNWTRFSYSTIKSNNNKKCWRRYSEIGTLICEWWEWKMVQYYGE